MINDKIRHYNLCNTFLKKDLEKFSMTLGTDFKDHFKELHDFQETRNMATIKALEGMTKKVEELFSGLQQDIDLIQQDHDNHQKDFNAMQCLFEQD